MVKHFSHRHELELCPTMPQPVHEDDEALICSVCEYELDLHQSGEAVSVIYQCSKSSNSKCHFYLHDLCFQLPREILHNSHPKHPLLLSLPPYQNDNENNSGEFTCNACGESGTCFSFQCPKCKFNLHVQCATLPQTPSRRQHHQHPLTLLFSVPNSYNVQQKMTTICDLCKGSISQGCWLYYCKECDYCTHLHCSIAEADDHHHE